MKKIAIKLLWIAVMAGILTGCGSREGEERQEERAEKQEEGQGERAEKQEEGQGERAEKQEEGQEERAGKQEEGQGKKQENGSELSEDFQAVVRDFSALFLSFDEDSYYFDQVLNEVQGYLEGEKNREETVDIVREALSWYQEEGEGLEEFTLDDGLADALFACKISAEEYKAFGNSRENELYNYSMNVSTLLEYLESAEELQESYEDLEFFYLVHRDEQDSMRGYYYYGCLNYWFVWADEEEKDYLHEQVISKIKACKPQNPVWYDDQEEVEEVVMGYLDEVEEINARMAKHIGEATEELYGMEQDVQEMLDAMEEKQAMDAKLARLKEINARIEEINKEAAQAKEDGDEEKLSLLKEEFETLVEEYEALMK